MSLVLDADIDFLEREVSEYEAVHGKLEDQDVTAVAADCYGGCGSSCYLTCAVGCNGSCSGYY